MNEVTLLIAKFGLPTAIAAVLLYMLLRGEVHFRYPRGHKNNSQDDSDRVR